MTSYTITNTTSGATIGAFEGATERDALDAMARDQGYDSFAAQCEEIGSSGSDISVEEIEFAGAAIDVELHRGTIDPAGEGDDADIASCTDYVLDAVRGAFPGAAVRAVGNGCSTRAIAADGHEFTRDVREAVQNAFDAWCAA